MNWLENSPWIGVHIFRIILVPIVGFYITRMVFRMPLIAFWRAHFWTWKDLQNELKCSNPTMATFCVVHMLILLSVMSVEFICFMSVMQKFDLADRFIIKKSPSERRLEKQLKRKSEGDLGDSNSSQNAVVDLEMDGETSPDEAGCCGGLTAEEIAEMKSELENAWQNPESASPEIREKLPPQNAMELAENALSDAQNDSDSDADSIDWNQTIFDAIDAMPEGLERSMIAIAVVEANEYMANMTPEEAAELEADFERKWAQELARNPNLPTEGVENEALMRTFKIGLAFSKSRLRAEMEEFEKEFPIPIPEVSEHDISLEEYREQYLQK